MTGPVPVFYADGYKSVALVNGNVRLEPCRFQNGECETVAHVVISPEAAVDLFNKLAAVLAELRTIKTPARARFDAAVDKAVSG